MKKRISGGAPGAFGKKGSPERFGRPEQQRRPEESSRPLFRDVKEGLTGRELQQLNFVLNLPELRKYAIEFRTDGNQLRTLSTQQLFANLSTLPLKGLNTHVIGHTIGCIDYCCKKKEGGGIQIEHLEKIKEKLEAELRRRGAE